MEAALSSRTLGELAVLTGDLKTGPDVTTAQAEDVIHRPTRSAIRAPAAGRFRDDWKCGRRGAT